MLELASDPDQPRLILVPEGVHDFRDAARDQEVCPSTCSNDPTKPQYTVLVADQTCAAALITRQRHERTLEIGSNKTIVGLGRGAAQRGVSMQVGSSQQVIVRNLALFDVNPDLIEAGDAFTLDAAADVWLDHCTMKWISDGFTDVGAGARNITFSWLHYDGVTSTECDGQHTRGAQISDATLTLHHSFFDHVMRNSPTVREALLERAPLQRPLQRQPGLRGASRVQRADFARGQYLPARGNAHHAQHLPRRRLCRCRCDVSQRRRRCARHSALVYRASMVSEVERAAKLAEIAYFPGCVSRALNRSASSSASGLS